MRVLVASILAGGVLTASVSPATPVRATLTTSTPKPIVDQPWRWTVTVRTPAGKPLPAKMRLQILLGTTVVGCWKGTAMVQCSGASSGTWIRLRGRRTGVLTWPAQSLGVRLTFQAVVVASGARVLGVDDTTDAGSGAASSGVTLLVTETEARVIAFAEATGDLSLAVAPPESAYRGPTGSSR